MGLCHQHRLVVEQQAEVAVRPDSPVECWSLPGISGSETLKSEPELLGRHLFRLVGSAAGPRGPQERMLVGVCRSSGPAEAWAVDVRTGAWLHIQDGSVVAMVGQVGMPAAPRCGEPQASAATPGGTMPFDLRLEIDTNLGGARVGFDQGPMQEIVGPTPKEGHFRLWVMLSRLGDHLELLEHTYEGARTLSYCGDRPLASCSEQVAISSDRRTGIFVEAFDEDAGRRLPAPGSCALIGQPALPLWEEQGFAWRVGEEQGSTAATTPDSPGPLLVGLSTAPVDDQNLLYAAISEHLHADADLADEAASERLLGTHVLQAWAIDVHTGILWELAWSRQPDGSVRIERCHSIDAAVGVKQPSGTSRLLPPLAAGGTAGAGGARVFCAVTTEHVRPTMRRQSRLAFRRETGAWVCVERELPSGWALQPWALLGSVHARATLETYHGPSPFTIADAAADHAASDAAASSAASTPSSTWSVESLGAYVPTSDGRMVPHQDAAESGGGRTSAGAVLERSLVWRGLRGIFFCVEKGAAASILSAGGEDDDADRLPPPDYQGWVYALCDASLPTAREPSEPQPMETGEARQVPATSKAPRFRYVYGFSSARDAALARAQRKQARPEDFSHDVEACNPPRQQPLSPPPPPSPFRLELQHDRYMPNPQIGPSLSRTSGGKKPADGGAPSVPAGSKIPGAAESDAMETDGGDATEARRAPLAPGAPMLASVGRQASAASSQSSQSHGWQSTLAGKDRLSAGAKAPDKLSRAARLLLQRRLPHREAYVCLHCLATCGAKAALRDINTAPLKPSQTPLGRAATPPIKVHMVNGSQLSKAASRCTVCSKLAPTDDQAEVVFMNSDEGVPSSSATPAQPLSNQVPIIGSSRGATTRATRLTAEVMGDEAAPPSSLWWEYYDPLRLAVGGGEAGWAEDGGRQLIRCGADGYTAALASCVWTSGVHTLSFRIDCARHNTGNMLIGVADATELYTFTRGGRGWALHPFYGTVHETDQLHSPGISTQIRMSARPELRGAAMGARVSVLVDMERHALAFAVNDGGWVDAEVKLPAAVRPYAALFWQGDAVSLRASRSISAAFALECDIASVWSAATMMRAGAAAPEAGAAHGATTADGPESRNDDLLFDDDHFRRREMRELLLDPELRRTLASLDPESISDLCAQDPRLRELLRMRHKGLPPALWSHGDEEAVVFRAVSNEAAHAAITITMSEPGGASCRIRCLPTVSLDVLAARFEAHVHVCRLRQRRARRAAERAITAGGSDDVAWPDFEQAELEQEITKAEAAMVEARALSQPQLLATRHPPLLLLLGGSASSPTPESLAAAGVRHGDVVRALAAVDWCPTCDKALGEPQWHCPDCKQDAEALSRSQCCVRSTVVDLVAERAAGPQTSTYDDGWVCSSCLFFNAWQLTKLSTQPSKTGISRSSDGRLITSSAHSAAPSPTAGSSAAGASSDSGSAAPGKMYAICRLCNHHDQPAGAVCVSAGLKCPVVAAPAPAPAKPPTEEAPSAEKLRQTALEEQVEIAKRARTAGEEHLEAGNWETAVEAFDEALEVFNMIAGRKENEDGTKRQPVLTIVISKEELLTTGLPELYCHKAEALLKLGLHEEALEAAEEAADLKPPGARLHCRSHCLTAAALRRLRRDDDAMAALRRFERVTQEHAAIVSQRRQLLRYQQCFHPAGSGESRGPPACQPPLPPPAVFVERPSDYGLLEPSAGRPGPRVASLLLAAFGEEDVRGELLATMSLHAKRAACCTCYTLRKHVTDDLHREVLHVRIEDATFDNAAFVGRLPNLATLHVQGELFLRDGIDLRKLRALPRIAVGKLGFEAALFLGAALSGGEHIMRLSSDACVALPPLRTRERVNLLHRQLKGPDLAVLLGALSLNRHLKELEIQCAQRGEPYEANVRAAMVGALPWPLLRHKTSMRFSTIDLNDHL